MAIVWRLPGIALWLARGRLAAAGADVAYARATLTPWGVLQLRDLEVRFDAPELGRHLVVRVPEATIALGLGVRRLSIRRARIVRPEVELRWGSPSDAPRAERAPRASLPVTIGDLELAGARFTYQNQEVGPIDLEARGIALEAQSAGAAIAVDVRSGPAALLSPHGRDEVASIEGRATLDAGGIGILGARVRHGSGELVASGRIGISRGLVLSIRGTADMADLVGAAVAGHDGERRISGAVEVDAHLVGRFGGETHLVGTARPAGPRRALGLGVRGSAEQVALAEGGIGLTLHGAETGALAVAFGGDGARPRYAGVVEATRELSEIGQAFHVALPVEGLVEGRVRVEGVGGEFVVRADVASGDLAREGTPLGAVAGDLFVDRQTLRVRAASRVPARELVVDVASCLGSGVVGVDAVATRVAAQELRALLGLPIPVDGDLEGTVAIVLGPEGRLEAEGRVASAAPLLRGVALGATRATFSTAQRPGTRSTFVMDFAAEAPTRLEGTLATEEAGARVGIHHAALPLGTALALAGLPTLPHAATVTGSGTLLLGARPAAQLELALSGEVEGEATIAGRQLACARLVTDDGVAIALDSAGELDLRSPSVATLWRHVERVATAIDVGAPLPALPLSGGPLALQGTLSQEPLVLQGRLHVEELLAPGIRLASLDGDLDLRQGALRLDRLVGVADGGALEGEIALATATTRVRLSASTLPVMLWEGATARLTGGVELDGGAASGQVEARLGAGRATLTIPPGEGTAADLVVEAWPLPAGAARLDARSRLTMSPEGLLGGHGTFAIASDPELGVPGILGSFAEEAGQIVLEARDQTGAAAIGGRLDPRELAWELDAVLEAWEPSPRLVARVSEQLPVALAGPVAASLTGRVELSGRGSAPVAIDARLDDARLRVGEREIVTKAVAHAHGELPHVTLDRLELAGPELDVVARGTTPGMPAELSLRVELGLLGALVDGLRSGGTLEGRWDPEREVARLAVSRGEIVHRELPWGIGAMRGELTWSPRAGLAIQELRGVVGDGSFRVQGAWGEERREIELDVVPVALPSRQELFRGLRGRVGGSVVLRPSGALPSTPLSIAGRITLHDGRFSEDLDLAALATASSARAMPRADEGPTLDLAIAFDEPVEVKNNVLDGAVDGGLTLSGPAADPRIAGRLEIEEGARMTLRGQRYEVTRGVLEGADLTRGRYRGELSASATIRSYDVELELAARGDGSAAPATTIAYSASPALPQEDVQALIMFGTTADRLPPGAARAFSGALLFAPLVRGLEGTSRRLLRVDRVRVEPYASRSEDVATARITVEKDIGKDLELVYSTSAGHDREDLIVVEYHGIPGDRKLTATREIDGSVSLDVGREVRFGSP